MRRLTTRASAASHRVPVAQAKERQSNHHGFSLRPSRTNPLPIKAKDPAKTQACWLRQDSKPEVPVETRIRMFRALNTPSAPTWSSKTSDVFNVPLQMLKLPASLEPQQDDHANATMGMSLWNRHWENHRNGYARKTSLGVRCQMIFGRTFLSIFDCHWAVIFLDGRTSANNRDVFSPGWLCDYSQTRNRDLVRARIAIFHPQTKNLRTCCI